MSETAIYVYCVVEAASLRSSARVPAGLPGSSRPALLELGGKLRAVVSTIDLEDYGPARIDKGLQNLEWVAGIALAHEAVVEHFAAGRGATVVPMSLFTIFSTEERAVAGLTAQRRMLTGALRRIRGCAEWGVRAVQTKPQPSRTAKAMPAPAASGAAFLAAKKEAREGRREASRQVSGAVEEAFAKLARLSRDSRRRTDVPDGAAAPPLLDAAFLVPAERQMRFKAGVKRVALECRDANVHLTLSGPWPAYNFVRAGEQS